jgi:VWFA-related protein
MAKTSLQARILFGALALLGGLGAVRAASPTPPQPRFSESTDVVEVEVPVQVLRDGQPVRGLTADDFEVWDGRKKQTITGFQTLDLSTPLPATAAGPAALPAAARRHFLLLFDLSFSEPKSLAKAREAAHDLLAHGLQPTDLVAVASYSTTRGPQLVLGFTPDRAQAQAALEMLGKPEMMDRSADPLRLMVQSAIPGANDIDPNLRLAQIKEADYTMLGENLRTLQGQLKSGEFAQKSNDVQALARSFAGLAHMMAGLRGRKYVVYLSEGFDSSLLLGSSDQKEIEDMAAASASGEYWKIDSGIRYGDTHSSGEMEQMLEEFRRADCIVQAVDVGGVREGAGAPGRTLGQDSLFMMADGTGGDLYRNFNDLSVAMRQMLDRTSVTYVLTFQPDQPEHDGAWHKLRVELKEGAHDARDVRGARVVARAGYYAPRPYAQRNPMERLLDAGQEVISGTDAGTISTAVLAAPFRSGAAATDTAYVPVLVEVDGTSLLAGSRTGTLPAEIYVYALDATGAVRDFVSQTVGLDLAKVAPALTQSGLKFFGHLDLPPGTYSLRVLVRNGATGASGLRTAALEVPAFAAGGPVLLPPFFPEPSGKWLIVREAPRQPLQTPQAGQPQIQPNAAQPYPFMIGQEPYVPASRPVLEPGKDARLSLVAYNVGQGTLQIRTRVLTAGGQELRAGELKLVGREPGGPAAPDRLLATFRPSGLQPGEYVLLVTLTDAQGRVETSTTPFRVQDAQDAHSAHG